MVKEILNKTDAAKVVAAIRKAESDTGLEIVVATVPRSSHAFALAALYRILGLVGLAILTWAEYQRTQWLLPTWAIEVLWIVTGILVLFFVLPAGLLRVFNRQEAEEVEQSAMAYFMRAGIHETQDRTGVLIYLSKFEHRVVILADSGIHAKVPKGYWKEKTDRLAKAIRSGAVAAEIVSLIEELHSRYGKDFPRRADDRNELSDEIRTE